MGGILHNSSGSLAEGTDFPFFPDFLQWFIPEGKAEFQLASKTFKSSSSNEHELYHVTGSPTRGFLIATTAA